MSLFEEHIDAVEIAAKTVSWMCFIAIVVLVFTGHVEIPLAIVLAIVWVSRTTIHHIKETRARWDSEGAEERRLRREQQHLKREQELRLQIQRQQRP
jgi:MFS superfamily sulfate permease-like transporter